MSSVPSGANLVVLWGRRPPPVGGVSRSVESLFNFLDTSADFSIAHGDLTKPRSLISLFLLQASVKRSAIHVCNVSTWRSVRAYSFVAVGTPGKAVVFLHGGLFANPLARSSHQAAAVARHLRRFDEIWATSYPVADLATQLSGRAVVVVSPYSPTTKIPSCGLASPDSLLSHTAIVAVWNGLPLYGVPIAVEAIRIVRSSHPEWQLLVLMYGTETRMARELRRDLEAFPWVSVVDQMDDARLRMLIASTTVLLRPTTTDGDSMLVRTAMETGTRVIASDVVPRPVGVEVTVRGGSAFAEAILGTGVVSDGTQMGLPVTTALTELVSPQSEDV